MKILIIDAFSEAHLNAFAALGLTVEYRPALLEEICANTAAVLHVDVVELPT